MTKRPRDSITASTYSEPPDRQASHDADGIGSQEDADGSSLKKARSFMATLVRLHILWHALIADVSRLAISVARGKVDAMKTDLAAATAEVITWSALIKHRGLPRKTSL